MLNWKRLGVLLVIVSLVGVFSLASAQDTYTLQVLHSSDNESAFQDPNSLEPKDPEFRGSGCRVWGPSRKRKASASIARHGWRPHPARPLL